MLHARQLTFPEAMVIFVSVYVGNSALEAECKVGAIHRTV